MMPDTLSVWLDRCRSALRVSEADLLPIAQRCDAATRDGRLTSVWHEAAAHFGTECHCARCREARKASRCAS